MKILLEGTDQQIKNLRELLSQGHDDLPKELKTASTEVVWTTPDVRDRYTHEDGSDLNDEEALDILDDALENEATYTQVWMSIDVACDFAGYKSKK